jgi:glucokinase
VSNIERRTVVSSLDFNRNNYQRYILVADVGGTNTYLAIMAVRNARSFDIVFKDSYLTKDLSNLHDPINETLRYAKDRHNIDVGIACVGAAGAVSLKRDNVRLTNANLEISTTDLLYNTMLRKFILLNDFEAIGYGIDLIDIDKDTIKLPHMGEDMSEDNSDINTVAVIGAGTGLGISIAPYNRKDHLHMPIPSEGGHMDFPPHNELELELMRHIQEKSIGNTNHWPDFETVLSGKGMEDIYDFLAKKKGLDETEAMKRISQLMGVEKLREIELNYENDDVCKKTIDFFVAFYARAARNLALMTECYSGLFIAGAIALKNMEKFKENYFMEEFERHHKRSDVLKRIPVYIITNRDIGLYGCCNVAVNFLVYNLK